MRNACPRLVYLGGEEGPNLRLIVCHLVVCSSLHTESVDVSRPVY